MSDHAPALFAGLDVSLADTHVCVIDADGETIFEAVVPSEPDALAKALAKGAPGCENIAIETGATTPWLWRELRDRGVPVTCIDARHANRALSMRRNKTDRNDALGLAELMRIGWYKEARVRDLDSQHIRSMLNARYQLRRCRRDILNQIRGIVKTFGLYTGSTATRRFPVIVREIVAGNPKAAIMLTPLLDALSGLQEQIGIYEAELRAVAKDSGVARRLVTVPGVGLLGCAGLHLRNRRSVPVLFIYEGRTLPRSVAEGPTIRRGELVRRDRSRARPAHAILSLRGGGNCHHPNQQVVSSEGMGSSALQACRVQESSYRRRPQARDHHACHLGGRNRVHLWRGGDRTALT